MKTLVLASLATALGLTLLNVKPAATYSGGPPPEHTGAPGEENCTACHRGAAANSGTARFTISRDSSTSGGFAAGQTYRMRVGFANDTRTKHGFELVVLDQNNAQIGTIQLVNATTTQIATSGGKQYIMHTNAGNALDNWTFDWVAPDSLAPGTVVTFYAAGNSANGRDGNSGDLIYTTSLGRVVTANRPRTVAVDARLYPNPALATSSVSLTLLSAAQVSLAVTSVTGAQVRTVPAQRLAAGQHTLALPISGLPAGHYAVQITTNDQQQTKTLVVL